MVKFIDRKIFPVVALLAMLATLAAMALIFFYAPVEQTMGIVQKIFYVHVPSAMASYAGFTVTAVCSLIYLFSPREHWDHGAVAGAELGLFYCVFVLISGPLWAYKAWGTAWTWDPQLTATFILFLLYGGYVLLRQFGGSSKRLKKIAAVLGVIAFVDIPLIHYSVRIWGGLHPVVEREGGGGLATEMSQVFGVSMLAFLLMFATLLWLRFRVRWREAELDRLYLEVEDLARVRGI
ncbi:cytochrome C assembly protein [Lujinxingia litoralis]|uniref:Heme exporter protein C n=1 Tax=Lujinxingia litoralis TaxID=2211119 RepID=A0A328CB79_9DELT|nr:cytochrome c biogenesis protein CcsA [Lujinxingia litoralis]RAL24800.1 cytochrome C assembly protein [Lujinxingia litoralis]